ncbi:MAG: PilN domain-containing protein [Alphaproteobacteria bacterium]|nr:PilN domain-containing protein [Alphaproteobacteria bacterium]
MSTAAHSDARSRFAASAVDWWLGELRATWAEIFTRVQVGIGTVPVIEAGEARWIVRRGSAAVAEINQQMAAGQRLRLLAQALPSPRGSRSVLVEVPHERALSKLVTLPQAARHELDRILRFEIGRQFPFSAERASFAYRPAGEAQASGPIRLEVTAVPREVIAEICEELRRAGLRARAILVESGLSPHKLTLPVDEVRRAGVPRTLLDRCLVGVAALSAAAALLSPVLHQRMRLAELDRELASLKPKAEAALARQTQQREDDGRIAAALHAARDRPAATALVNELSRALPDGAWLTALRLSGREIVIDGLSPSAAATALALEQNPAFSAVGFRSAITRDAASGLEHFQLALTVAEVRR